MAKVVKSTREVVDVNEEVKKVTKNNKENKAIKESDKKNVKKSKKVKARKSSYFSEVRKEMSKVTWPSKGEMVKYTCATLGFVIFFSLFFYVILVLMAMLKEII